MGLIKVHGLSQHCLSHVREVLAIISSDILSVPFSLLSPFHLVVLVGFDIVLSAGTYFSAVLFCLGFCVCVLHFSGCRVIIPLASSVCYLVGVVGLGIVQWEELVPVHWKVECSSSEQGHVKGCV